MRDVINTGQAEAWNGSEGNHWAAHHTRYDAVNSGFNEALCAAAAVREADRVLDVGCGNGQLTRLLARRAHRGGATGVDLSEPMLTRATTTAEAEGVANVVFERGDVQVHPFPAARFDVAVSRFGVMFFSDPVAAFANVRRALRPGGQLVFVCLRELSQSDLGPILDRLSDFLDRPYGSGPDGLGPTSLADPGHIHDLLGQAGFRDTEVQAVDAPQRWGRDADDAGRFLGDWVPVRHHLSEVEPECAERARKALIEMMRVHEHDGAVVLNGAAWLVTARRPAPQPA